MSAKVLISSLSNHWAPVLATNFATASGYPSRVKTTTPPNKTTNPGLIIPSELIPTGPDWWQASTQYKVGATVRNGANVYQCVIGGTSAGSGGPSGTTGAAILDNNVQWTYLPVVATWAASTIYAVGAFVQNGLNVYQCVVGGVSAGSGGPTGTSGSTIADGTVSWVFIRVAPDPSSPGPPIGDTPNNLRLIGFGTGTGNFNSQLLGWGKTPKGLYFPTLICELQWTLGSQAGINNTEVTAAMAFATTVTIVTGNANVDVVVTAGTDRASICEALVDLKGFPAVEFIFNNNSSATDSNLMASPV
jgi:hypothetical protein